MTISIIVPLYNAENTISKMIESILQQHYSDWELLLINDGSSDKSLSICMSFAEKESRIRIFSQPNQGVSTARNRGLEEAKGKFIVFVDADDEVNTRYLADLIDEYVFYKEPNIIIQGYDKECAVGCYKKIELISESKLYKPNIQSFFYDFNILTCGYSFSKLFLKDIVVKNNLKFKQNITFCEDLIFLLNYLCYCDTILLSNKANYFYNHTPNSLSIKFHDFESEYRSYCFISQSYKKLLMKKGITELKAIGFLYDNYKLPIVRPLASITFVEKGSFSQKNKIVKSIDEDYFDILRHFFKHAEKYKFVTIFCNKRFWYMLGVLLYFRYYLRPRMAKLLIKIFN